MTIPTRGPARATVEPSLEELIDEGDFVQLLRTQADTFFRLTISLLARCDASEPWKKTHYARLVAETDALESFLDDYGARYNRTFAEFTELVASLRWFANAGYAIAHLLGRLASYGAGQAVDFEVAREAIDSGGDHLCRTAKCLIVEIREEATQLGLSPATEELPVSSFRRAESLLKLPRNVGQEELENEEQKIAEVATKFLQAAEMVAATGVREISDERDRHTFLSKVGTEEQARVYEAMVHNLQSTYDTHIRNTVLEGRDPRLAQLRGNAATALHLLQAVTHLTHFLERHEGDTRPIQGHRRVFQLVDRPAVEGVTVNIFMLWAHRMLQNGTELAEDLLPEYTNVQDLEVELPEGMHFHARPAALLVAIVNHYATPVEMEIGDQRCDAGSILKILVAAGSRPDARQFVFRGDERPLSDIRLLFQHGLGEDGMEKLPPELDYLRQR